MAKTEDTTPVEETVTENPVKKFLNKKTAVIASAVVGTVAVAATAIALKARNAEDSFEVLEPDTTDAE